jgi:YVTN family beta-propeller protein
VASEVANTVHVIDAAGGAVVKNVPVGKRPRRFALSPDGRELWVSNELDASVSVIDTQSLAVTHTVRFELQGMRASDITPVGLVFSPDGTQVFVALGRANHVAFVDARGKRTTQHVLVGRRAWGLATSRDGTRLYVANGLSDDLTLVDVARGRAVKTVAVGRVPHTVVVDD